MSTATKVPYRQVRALYDDKTITVYQAYNAKIADAAVEAQKLSASPVFGSRMTWIKPSWCWMNYRAGYSYKDKNQERILALKLSHEGFLELLRRAELTHGIKNDTQGEQKKRETVKVQWDPERDARLERLEYRSIQIGIPAGLVDKWIDEWIVGIEDVTETARELKRVLDEDKEIDEEGLRKKGLFPDEQEFVLPEELRDILQMDAEPKEKKKKN